MKETKINLLDENIYSFTTKNKLNAKVFEEAGVKLP